MAIKDYYNGLTREERRKFVARVCEVCDICYSSFYRKLREGFKTIEEEAILKLIANGAGEH